MVRLIARRRGREVFPVKTYSIPHLMATVGLLGKIIGDEGQAAVHVDSTGLGIVDGLMSLNMTSSRA
jgi:hypothetical protein